MTGGNWQSVTHRNGVILVGHLRLPVEVATKMMSRSGQLAVFLAVLPCKHHIPKKVVWIPKKPGLNEESYWVYCKEQSIAKDLALAFRQGGGADVGLIDGKDSDFPTKSIKQFILQGSPRHWETHQVDKFLKDQDWSDIQILARRRGSRDQGDPQWIFKG